MRSLIAALTLLAALSWNLDVHAQAPADADGNNLTLRPGPAVWREEYWDVKPDKFPEFVETYRREVYGLMRRIPGYRGYSFLTTVPATEGPATANTMGLGGTGGTGPLIGRHFGIHTEDGILTERSVNIGNLMGRTHNVNIIHHIDGWSRADQFLQAFAALYASEHGGADVWEHLAKVLYPLVNNKYDVTFRLVETGFPHGLSKPGTDADGLDLTPRPEPSRWIKEYWQVDAKDFPAFLSNYEKSVYSLARRTFGYRGISVITTLPPAKKEPQLTQVSRKTMPLGGSDDFMVPHPGLLMDGTIRTNWSVNFAQLFKKTFTVQTIHHQATWRRTPSFTEAMTDIYAAENNGADAKEVWRDQMMKHAKNHWDMLYRAVEVSFAPDGPAKSQ